MSEFLKLVSLVFISVSVLSLHLVGVGVDCTAWVESGRIDESERHDRNWTNWTTFAQVKAVQ